MALRTKNILDHGVEASIAMHEVMNTIISQIRPIYMEAPEGVLLHKKPEGITIYKEPEGNSITLRFLSKHARDNVINNHPNNNGNNVLAHGTKLAI